LPDSLTRLFTTARPPIAAKDLGAGARVLVPNGAAFGTPQLWRDGEPIDWVRGVADGYWVEGDRGSSHSGVDVAWFTRPWGRQTAIAPLPSGLPVRAPVDAVVEATGRDADPEPGPGSVVLVLGAKPAPRLYVHLTDFHVTVKKGMHVRAGDVLGETTIYSRRHPVVVLHVGIGVLVRGTPPNPLDPTPLVRRWKWRHPVYPGSPYDAARLREGALPGRWRGPGRIEGFEPRARYDLRVPDVFD